MLAAKMTGALIFGIVFYRLGKCRYLARSGAGMSLVVLYKRSPYPLGVISMSHMQTWPSRRPKVAVREQMECHH